MRTPPQHDRAALTADGASLRRCADRLGDLAAQLPEGAATDATDATEWSAVLAGLARRCEVAAADLEAAAALFAEDAAGPGLASLTDAASATLGLIRRARPCRTPADPAGLGTGGPLEL